MPEALFTRRTQQTRRAPGRFEATAAQWPVLDPLLHWSDLDAQRKNVGVARFSLRLAPAVRPWSRLCIPSNCALEHLLRGKEPSAQPHTHSRALLCRYTTAFYMACGAPLAPTLDISAAPLHTRPNVRQAPPSDERL